VRGGRRGGAEPTGEFSNVCWHDTRDLLSRGSDRWDARGMTIMFIICTLAGIGLSKRRYR